MTGLVLLMRIASLMIFGFFDFQTCNGLKCSNMAIFQQQGTLMQRQRLTQS